MIKKRKTHGALLEQAAGILISGILVQVIELLVAAMYPQLAGSRTSFALGLWIGVATAVVLAAHMHCSIARALAMQSDGAERYMRKVYFLRTAVILAVAAAVHYLGLGYVMATFTGMLCLKAGVFLQPLIHGILLKIRGEG